MSTTSKNVALVRALLRDLVTDVRCAERDGLDLSYVTRCRWQIATLFPLRNTGTKLDAYGWPEILNDYKGN